MSDHTSTAAEIQAQNTVRHEGETLDDVMLAMDVVDTLRHREQMVLRELDTEGREQELVDRLKDIYTAQGIDVPEAIIRDGVKALEENRFVYSPPKPSLSVTLAKLYVARDKWLKPFLATFAGLVALGSAWHFGVDAPRQARLDAQRIELTETLPAALEALREEAQNLGETENADRQAETWFQDGMHALENSDRSGALRAQEQLINLKNELTAAYDVRIVSRPGEYSGVFRIPDNAPNTRNYYLIVEAIDGAGRAIDVTINSEENQNSRRVNIWGVRVPKPVFDQVAEDKQDDQIIQNSIIGRKDRGRLDPEFSVQTLPGAIFEWK